MAARVWTALSTVMVALVLALSIPVSQLRTANVEHSCCCPDPAKCHCPDHDESPPGPSQLRACHRTTQITIAPTLSAFVAPVLVPLPARTPARLTVSHAAPAPHAEPPPARPDAPS